MEGGVSIGKGWMAGGARMEEVRQRRKEEAGRAEERVGPSNEAEEERAHSSDLKTIRVVYLERTIGKAVFDPTGRKQYKITEATPNQLKLGEGGYDDELSLIHI